MPPSKDSARELLELEREHQRGGLDPSQSERWSELATEVFGSDDAGQQRRSFRLPVEAPATVGVRAGEFATKLVEVSQLGLALSGAVFAHISDDDAVVLKSVAVAGDTRIVDLRCEVVRLLPSGSPPVVGVRFADDTSPQSKQRFFDEVYYPLYMSFLAHLASE